MVSLSLDLSRFIDIFRKKPHLPVLVDALAVISGARCGVDPEELVASIATDPAIRFASCDPRLAKRLPLGEGWKELSLDGPAGTVGLVDSSIDPNDRIFFSALNDPIDEGESSALSGTIGGGSSDIGPSEES